MGEFICIRVEEGFYFLNIEESVKVLLGLVIFGGRRCVGRCCFFSEDVYGGVGEMIGLG